jgi:hypothetical protein
VCFTGTKFGSNGSISTIQPKRLGSFSSLFDIAAVVELAPGLPERRHPIARVALCLFAADARNRLVVGVALVGPEVEVEILFRGEIGVTTAAR